MSLTSAPQAAMAALASCRWRPVLKHGAAQTCSRIPPPEAAGAGVLQELPSNHTGLTHPVPLAMP